MRESRRKFFAAIARIRSESDGIRKSFTFLLTRYVRVTLRWFNDLWTYSQ